MKEWLVGGWRMEVSEDGRVRTEGDVGEGRLREYVRMVGCWLVDEGR